MSMPDSWNNVWLTTGEPGCEHDFGDWCESDDPRVSLERRCKNCSAKIGRLPQAPPPSRAWPEVGQVWRHYKGNEYTVKDIGTLEATTEPCVMYFRTDGSDPRVWVRAMNSWMETVDIPEPSTLRTQFRFTQVLGW